jgi:phosphoribosylglycinamide formyltransferase 1
MSAVTGDLLTLGSRPMRVGVLLGDRLDLFDAVRTAPGVVITSVVCEHPHVERAARESAPTRMLPRKAAPSREVHERQIADWLSEHGTQVLVTAGWLWLLTADLLATVDYRAVNVHPTLLPAFPGRHSVERAFAAGARQGATIHLLDDGVDTGAPLAQAVLDHVPRTAEDTRARLAPLEAHLMREVLGELACCTAADFEQLRARQLC